LNVVNLDDFSVGSLESVAGLLETRRGGLNRNEVEQRAGRYGKNVLKAKADPTLWFRLWKQLSNFMILILIAAACISGFIGDFSDTIAIVAIVMLNAVVGLVQEWRADNAMRALMLMGEGKANVIRADHAEEIAAEDVVPGDVISLQAGDVLVADVRFFEVYSLKIDESALTGESVNIEKIPEELPAATYQLGDRINLGFKGTFVTTGHGLAYVIATGMDTEIGRIAKLIQADDVQTPLQRRLDDFGKRLTYIILVLCLIFFGVGWFRGEPWSVMLLTSISLAVAAIPEALPALVTITLSVGATRLAKNNALVRKLQAVETLGSVTYICTDKTGTLTLNKMKVQEIYKPGELTFERPVLHKEDFLFEAIALNNDVVRNKEQQWMGDSTEVALAIYAHENKFERATVEKEFPRIGELPFDSKRKCMTTFHQAPYGVVAIVKGGVDILLKKLATSQLSSIPEFEKSADAMARKGFRTLGYGVRFFDSMPADTSAESIESSLMFIGVVGMIDPPRMEVREAIVQCKAAGITPVMITGDHKLTANAIARNLGIIASDQDLIIDGIELQKLDDQQFDSMVEKVRVYARVDPEQKLRIITSLQSRHQFVAMTGDGVNDAPALKNADIGIAMGINGTEVSKEAAHMILLDDNFATIVVAVKHGRRIFDNILKFIKYILAGNAGELLTLFIAPFFGLPIPLLAIHILWINLITDGLPGLALAFEPSEQDIMQRRPRKTAESIFTWEMGLDILGIGLLICAVTLSMQTWAMKHEGSHWQTMTFTVLCFSQLGYAMSVRSSTKSIFQIGLLSNKPVLFALLITFALQLSIIYVPFLNAFLKTSPLSLAELALTIAASSVVFWAAEAKKLIQLKLNSKPKN
jgi:P-type Ca2+ transporter type 2C